MNRSTRLLAASAAAFLLAAPAVASANPPPTVSTEEDGLNGTQREEVMQLIESWIINNPSVLLRVLQRVGSGAVSPPEDGNIDALVARSTPEARAAFGDLSRGAATMATPGDDDATVVIAYDYACPFCRTIAPRVDELLRRRPGIRLVLRETPILTRESDMAARVGLAVARQSHGMHLAYHRALMSRRGALNERTILEAASAAGADLARVARDAADPEIVRGLDENRALMRGIGVLATPMIASGGRILVGAPGLAEIEAMVGRRPGQ